MLTLIMNFILIELIVMLIAALRVVEDDGTILVYISSFLSRYHSLRYSLIAT
ncbi:MAG: hypothetical protein RBT15_04230 [Gudongella sp.]|nr:hypothetical protein [Gudongella sp.]